MYDCKYNEKSKTVQFNKLKLLSVEILTTRKNGCLLSRLCLTVKKLTSLKPKIQIGFRLNLVPVNLHTGIKAQGFVGLLDAFSI